MGKRNNFSLVELMCIVLAAVTASALLVPALAGSAAVAKSAGCSDNLRRLGEALARHGQENDNVLLPARILAKDNDFHSNRGLDFGRNVTWAYALRNDIGLSGAAPAWEIELPPEVKRGFLSCPESPMRSQSTTRLTYGMLAYWIGGEFGPGYGIKRTEMATKYTQLKSPEKKGYLCDASSAASEASDPAADGLTEELADTFWVLNSGKRLSRERHGDGTNFLFADGHAAKVTTGELRENGACMKNSGTGSTSRNYLLGWYGMK